MRELAHQQDARQAERAVTEERGPSLAQLQQEDLPPLDDLIREYNAMVQERLKSQQEAELHFSNTMYCWSLRERGEA